MTESVDKVKDTLDFSRDKSLQALKLLLDHLEAKYELTASEIITRLEAKLPHSIPVSIFRSTKLPALQLICKYLHENERLSFSQIAKLLKRNPRTIWTTYKAAQISAEKPLLVEPSHYHIPASFIADRRYSTLEAVVVFLRQHDLTYAQIATMLGRDYKTIYTTFWKAMAK